MNMDIDTVQHLLKLKGIHQKRLHILEEKVAKFGDLDVPAYILIEIDELRAKIADIEEQLSNLDDNKNRKASGIQGDLRKLRTKLMTHFNLEELHTLCFDLGIDNENFPPLKEGYTRELISY